MDYIIVGLGNPGAKYTYTRHNTGWLFLDHLCEKTGLETNRLKFKATCTEGTLRNKKVLVLRPQTFMNLSGESVREAAAFYKVNPENIIVICDDISLPCGRVRIRTEGSAGGHNGLKNIIEQLNSDKFIRIKIGITGKPDQMDLKDWVIGGFSDEDAKKVKARFDDVFNGICSILDGNTAKAMELCNRRADD